ncbi:dihydrofolate reductase family protein [Dyadobacter fanqingshengii]|uniref:Dihydrofolate reductase family protein n=1 Tax=Dyadobacter fanqingshengii TaxID=2906443 RepID=A0A9X1PB66_9BACT|nr:dihydrofolate reductase family protein [Dyadobacter fanqingshengii]MCF0040448.1 dihydrofolate reductase family protein [Dyadobacter fanqingshengii]USJ37810.1 dihydrofolate reductase family protein [Dyadobacter fanqingshengii]
MRKIVAAINMTLDGFCDHTAISPGEEIHQHYAELIKSADIALYGRITYLLMEYWKSVVENPTGDKSTDDFAVSMDRIPKVVFSHTLKNVGWQTARIAKRDLKDEVQWLKKQHGGDILVGSRSLIIALINLGLLDELQIMVHSVIVGKGLPLFEMISDRTVWNLVNTKTFGSGAVTLYYQPSNTAYKEITGV